MSYYESANGIQITYNQVWQELAKHGMTGEDAYLFFDDNGWRTYYDAQAVLRWLGY